MSDFKAEVAKQINVSLALFRFQYTKKDGQFSRDEYKKALENFSKTSRTTGIYPPDEFLILGVEHLHELGSKHERMLIKIAHDMQEADERFIPDLMKKLIDAVSELKKYAEKKGLKINQSGGNKS